MTLSVADRQAANEELGIVLQKQLELQEANAKKQLEQAEFELSLNKENIELKEQVLIAEKNLADVMITTIRSRCQMLPLPPLQPTIIEAALIKEGATANEAKNFAIEAQGNWAIAKSLLSSSDRSCSSVEMIFCTLIMQKGQQHLEQARTLMACGTKII